MEKDSTLIINKILDNQNIKKMLYYPVRECLSMPNLNQEQTYSLIENNISFIPKIKISENTGKITNPGFKKVYRFYSKDTRQSFSRCYSFT